MIVVIFTACLTLDVHAEDAEQIVCERLICFYIRFFSLHIISPSISSLVHFFSFVLPILPCTIGPSYESIKIVAIEEHSFRAWDLHCSLCNFTLISQRERERDIKREIEIERKLYQKKKEYLHVYIFQRFSFYFHLIP